MTRLLTMTTDARMRKPPTAGALNANERFFALEYLIDRNGTRAYKSSHPRCASHNTAAVQASRLLRKPKVKAFIEQELGTRAARLQMSGDEALAYISIIARADIGDAYDEDGHVQPVHLWPESLRLAVKTLKPGPLGVTIVLHDKLKAAELMARAAGKLKDAVDLKHTFDHASYLSDEPP
jgi:phage terminase small subunit